MADQEDLGVLLSKIAVDVADLKKGLQEGRNEMQSFKTMAQGVGESVKKAFAFAGIAVGIYEVVTALRDFAKDAAMVGARTETLEIAMNQVGKTYGMSAASLKYYVNELKGAGITTQESMLAVTKFLASGLPLDRLKELATRARDIGVVAGVNTSEALNRMVQGIITGEQETLRRLMIQVGHTDDIYKRYAATLGTTADQLNSVQKAQAVLNEVMRLSAGFAGVAAEADASVGKQMASMTRFAEEAKNSLWALFGPVMLEVIQQMSKGWKELKTWADANKESLSAWGKSIAELIQRKIELIATIGKLIAQNRELILVVLEFLVFYKVAGWIAGFAIALKAASVTMAGAATTAKGLQAALLGLTKNPWVIAIAVVLTGLAAVKRLQEKHPETAPLALAGEAWGVMTPEQQEDLVKTGEALKKPKETKAAKPEIKPESPEEAARQAQAALEKALREALKSAGKEKGGKGAGGEGIADRLLTETLKMLKAKREAEFQEAENSLELLKSTNEKKRAELSKSLAEELIDGNAYYQSLQDMQKAETDAALALIEKKKQIQIQAHQEALQNIADKTLPGFKDLSDEARAIAQQTLEAQHRKEMSKLAMETAKAKLEGEVKVTEELKRQVEVQKQFQQRVEDLELSTAWGPIEDQEARLRQLYLEWQRAKAEAIKEGVSPEMLARMEAAYGRKTWNAGPQAEQAAGMASAITQWFSSAVDAIMQGGQDLKKTLNGLFKAVFTEAMKPGLKELQQLLMNGFKELFGAAGGALGSAIMGVIGLVGMMLTSGGSSSWSPSAVQSGVTAHEAVRGVIAGDTSIPIAEIGVSLQDALVSTNGILMDIERNTRGSGAGGSIFQVSLEGIEDAVRGAMDRYFADRLQLGRAF